MKTGTTNNANTVTFRSDGYYNYPLLKRAQEQIILEQYGQAYILPANKTDTAFFRRYNALASEPVEMMEGVTPAGSSLTYTDIQVQLKQYGDFVEFTDKLLEMHEDQLVSETVTIMADQAAEMWEKIRFGRLSAGTNVYYLGGGIARNTVKTVWSRMDQRRVVAALQRQKAAPIKDRVLPSVKYGTESIAPSFVAICHTDLESTIRDLEGFSPAEKYASEKPGINEIGKCENVRYITTTLAPVYDGEGGSTTAADGLKSTGDKADVYPILILGRDAYGTVNFKGRNSLNTFVHIPKVDSSDKLAQRGHVGWKGYLAATILNDAWMMRVETAIKE